MNENVKRLIDRLRNDLWAIGLSLTRRDRAQARLLANVSETLSLLETEMLKSTESATGDVK
jgi:hypothetical protein